MMILHRDASEVLAARAVFFEIGGGAQGKPAGGGSRQASHSIEHHRGTRHPAILWLVVTHYENRVVETRGHGHHSTSERFGPRRAVVGDPGDRNAK